MTTEIETTTTPAAAAPPPRDWLATFRRARLWGGALDPQRRERLGRLRARANAAILGASTRAAYEDHPAESARAEALRRRADDLEHATHARPAIVAALLVERYGGAEAALARLAADVAGGLSGLTPLAVAGRDAVAEARGRLAAGGGSYDALLAEARARHRVAELEREERARCEAQAEQQLRQVLAGDTQAIFRSGLFSQYEAMDLAGPAATWCAFLVNAEDHPDD